MDINSGKIQDMMDWEEKLGKIKFQEALDNNEIVPVDGVNIDSMKKWNRKQRRYYAKLLRKGFSTEEAFLKVTGDK